jgi:cobalt transporter subunit CbtB
MTTTTHTQTATTQIQSGSKSRSQTLIAASMAAFLGMFLVWGVGFSHVAAAHNAAHDTRHSNGFPCH